MNPRRIARGGLTLALLVLVGAAASGVGARELPWLEPGALPLPEGVRSVEIRRHDEPLRQRPSARSKRRGSAAAGVLLPLYGAQKGPGCRERWLLVGPTAWVCEDHVRLSRAEPLRPNSARDHFADGMPLRYHFVGRDGSFGYAKLRLAEEGVPDAQLEPGFAVAIIQEANKAGEAYGLTTKGLWVPMRDVRPVRALDFHGAEVDTGTLSIGWVFAREAPVYEKPLGRRRPKDVHDKFEQLLLLEQKKVAGRRWFRLGEDRWVSERHVRAPTPAEPPAEVLPGERWIDVEIQNQVTTAYEGRVPRFVTMVSTGRGRGRSELATPKGVHRVWVKLRTTDMDNLENEDAGRFYAMQDVPWVMFFKKGYGLHGTFWHRQFGRVRSHGCVNLTPLDAQRLFHWTSPRLPAGWTAALPTDYDPGTIVRVR